ncbi:MAG: tetratricopeptide repeat protein [Candidatus Hodarchaeota archaeon]
MPVDNYPKFCKNCGTKLLEGKPFCHNCGVRVLTEATKPKTDPFEKKFGYMPEKTKSTFYKAVKLINEKKIERGLKYLNEAIDLSPELSDLWLFKGRAYGIARSFKEALECYDKALELKPNDYEIMFGRAVTARFSGNWKESLKTCENLLKRYPNSPEVLKFKEELMKVRKHEEHLLDETDNPDLLLTRAIYLAHIFKYNELALELLDKATQIDPSFDKAWEQKGNINMMLERRENAIKCFNKALELNPDNFMLWVGKGIALLGQKDHQESLKCLDKALELNPNDEMATKARERILFELKEEERKRKHPSVGDLIQSMDEVVDMVKDQFEDEIPPGENPFVDEQSFSKFRKKMITNYINSEDAQKSINIPDKYKNYAMILKNSNETDEFKNQVKEIFTKLKVKDFSAEIAKYHHTTPDLTNKAMFLFTNAVGLTYQNRFMESLKVLDEALRIDQNIPEIWAEKGTILVELNQLEEAIRCYEIAINLKPSMDGAWSLLGRVLIRLQRFDDALLVLDMALALNPNLALAWMNKGNAMDSGLNPMASLLCYNKALEINPRLASAWVNKGNFLLNYDIDLQQSIDCFNETLKIDPKHHGALVSKALALGKIQKYNEAMDLFETIQSIYPTSPFVWESKGVVFAEMGKYDDAISCFDKALKINPNLKTSIENRKKVLMLKKGAKVPTPSSISNLPDPLLKLKGSEAFQKVTQTFFVYKDLKDLISKVKDKGKHEMLYNLLEEGYGKPDGGDNRMKCVLLEELGKEMPNESMIWNLLQEIYDELNEHENQITTLENLLKINQYDEFSWHQIGLILSLQGNFMEGISKFQKVLEINPYNYDALYNLSLSYEILGRKEEAIETLSELLQKNPQDQEANKRINNLKNDKSEIFNKGKLLYEEFLKKLYRKTVK